MRGIDVIDRKAAEYEALQDSAASAARRGYVDAVIDPKDTRKHVIAAFEMLFTKREDRPGENMERYKRGGRMKQSLRKCISVLLLLFCTITLCACGSRNNTSGLTDEESESWKTQTVSFVSQMTTMSDEDLESLLQYGNSMRVLFQPGRINRDVPGHTRTRDRRNVHWMGKL